MSAEELLTTMQTGVDHLKALSSPVKAAYQGDAMKMVRHGINALVDTLPGLLKALDEVTVVYPFVGGMCAVCIARYMC